jgi:hypothetical protein
MANRRWLEEVQERLARSALPPGYIRRFMEELSDHLQDLTEENMSTEANASSRLGEPQEVARAAAAAYRRRSFLGRHPTAAFLVFAVSPAVSLILVFGLMALGARTVCCTWLGVTGNEVRATPPGPLELLATECLFSLLFVVIPVILTTVAYGKLVQWSGVARTWMVVSCGVLAAMVIPCWHARAIELAGHPGVLCALWIPGLHGWIPPSVCGPLLQLLVPLAIGWWFLRRRRDQGQLQPA